MKDKLIDHAWKHAEKKPQDTVSSVNAETERVKAFLRANNYADIVRDVSEWMDERSNVTDKEGRTIGAWHSWWKRSSLVSLLPVISAKALRGEHVEGLGLLLLNIGMLAAHEGYNCTSERYILLALLSDMIFKPDADYAPFSGAYMHLRMRGLTDGEVAGIRKIVKGNPTVMLPDIFFPKALLIASSLCRTPSVKELLLTDANREVASYLHNRVVAAKTNDDKGKTLEAFVEHAFSAINGFIPDLTQKDHTKQYDLICEVSGDQETFRKEIGRHIMGEAKNTNVAPPTHDAHRLDSLLDSSGIKLGIIIAKKPASPSMKSELTRIRNKQRHIILYLTMDEICGELIGGNLYTLIKARYDKTKLNLELLKPMRGKRRTKDSSSENTSGEGT